MNDCSRTSLCSCYWPNDRDLTLAFSDALNKTIKTVNKWQAEKWGEIKKENPEVPRSETKLGLCLFWVMKVIFIYLFYFSLIFRLYFIMSCSASQILSPISKKGETIVWLISLCSPSKRFVCPFDSNLKAKWLKSTATNLAYFLISVYSLMPHLKKKSMVWHITS